MGLAGYLKAVWRDCFFVAPRGPLKGPRGPLKGPRGPFKGPRSVAILVQGKLLGLRWFAELRSCAGDQGVAPAGVGSF